jgi:hypothetical protein
MPPVGFEPTIAVGERTYTYALYRAAAGAGKIYLLGFKILCCGEVYRPFYDTLLLRTIIYYNDRTHQVHFIHTRVRSTHRCVSMYKVYLAGYIFYQVHGPINP